MHRTTTHFWRDFEKLPESVQKVARRNILLLKANPRHPSLHFKKIDRFWSIRVGIAHCCIGFGSGIMTNISE